MGCHVHIFINSLFLSVYLFEWLNVGQLMWTITVLSLCHAVLSHPDNFSQMQRERFWKVVTREVKEGYIVDNSIYLHTGENSHAAAFSSVYNPIHRAAPGVALLATDT